MNNAGRFRIVNRQTFSIETSRDCPIRITCIDISTLLETLSGGTPRVVQFGKKDAPPLKNSLALSRTLAGAES